MPKSFNILKTMFSEKNIDRYIKITIFSIVAVLIASGYVYFYNYKQPSIGRATIAEQEIEELQKQVKKKPRNATARFYLARAYLKNNQHDDAIKEMKEVLKINKKNQNAVYFLAVVYKLKGKDSYKLAKKRFEEVIKLTDKKQYAGINANLKGSLYFMGEMLLDEKKYKKSLDFFDRSSKIGNVDADALRNMGRAYVGLKKYKDGEKYLKDAIRFVPNYSEVHYELGKLYQTQGKKSKAKKSYQKAIKYKSDYKQAKEALESL